VKANAVSNEKFIIGAKMAFPDLRLDELFYLYDNHPEQM